MTTELDEQFEEWLKQTRAESQQNKFGFEKGDRFLAIVSSEEEEHVKQATCYCLGFDYRITLERPACYERDQSFSV